MYIYIYIYRERERSKHTNRQDQRYAGTAPAIANIYSILTIIGIVLVTDRVQMRAQDDI